MKWILAAVTVLNIAIAIWSYNRFDPQEKVNAAFSAGAKSGATAVCWHLTFMGNEKCTELADRIQ